MDPTANLNEALDLAHRIQDLQDGADDSGNLTQDALEEQDGYAARLAELVLALDQWIFKGGFLPNPWQRPQGSLRYMPVIAVGGGAVYLRIPEALQEDCNGCDCDYCTQHPEKRPMWDTLAVPTEIGERRKSSTWTVHLPDPASFMEAIRRKR